MRIVIAISTAVLLIAPQLGCLDPLVDDVPGASARLLPPGTVVPSAGDNPELANRIAINDGIDDQALATNNGVIPLATGVSNGQTVRYWSLGPATRAPSPLYEFYTRSNGALEPAGHPALVDSLPGDTGYTPLHTLQQVVLTSKYAGEIITTTQALADAVAIGIAEQPVPLVQFVTSPVVLPNVRLDVGSAATVAATTVYGRGFAVGMFRFGGALGVQPGGALLPTSQLSFLRKAPETAFNMTRPVFRAGIPAMPPGPNAGNYTPLSAVIQVDLSPTAVATDIMSDEDLFVRSGGMITGVTENVQQFLITNTLVVWQLQFKEGEP